MQAVEDSPLLRAALDYVARGWKVFPLHTPNADGSCSCRKGDCGDSAGKHPRVMHGLKEATLDAGQVRSWWSMWPDANIGVVTGSGLMVLDVDPRHDGTTVGLELPDTLRSVTPRGGEHWYFRVGGAVPNSAGLIGPGLDIRGDGGYVVAPPSAGATGRPYGWDAGNPDAIATAPEWLLQRATAKRHKQVDGTAAPDAFLAGGRNSALTELAGSMVRKAFGVEAVEAALLSENARRCRPPLDEVEVCRIAKSVFRYEPGAPVVAKSGAAVLSGVELAQRLPAVPWVCERLELAPGAVSIWAGYGYSGKSLGAQALLLAVAADVFAWGALPVTGGPVVHLDYEQGRRLTSDRYQRLARAMGQDLAALGDRIRAVPFPDHYLDTLPGLAWLEDICQGTRVCLVDSLRAALPSADENSSEIRRHLDPLARISERTDCAIVLIHHGRKTGESDRGKAQGIRGSGAIFDAAQAAVVFAAQKGEPACVSIEKARISGAQHDDLTLTFKDLPGPSDDPELDGRDTPKWGLSVACAGVAPQGPVNAIRAALLATVRQMPGQSQNMILASAKAGNRSQRHEVLTQMLADGALFSTRRVGRGGGMCISLPEQLGDELSEGFDER